MNLKQKTIRNNLKVIRMKKLSILICMNFIIVCACAQKTYTQLSNHFEERHDIAEAEVGNKINNLSSQGYIVEKMTARNENSYSYNIDVILSKTENQNYEEKSYVFIGCNDYVWYLSGDIPSELEKVYWDSFDINKLSENGFQLEQYDGAGIYRFFLFSKKKSDNTSICIKEGEHVAVKEIARYNMEGLPIDESYEGIQIIVYSDYTTKVLNNK